MILLVDAQGLGYRAHYSLGGLDGGLAFGFVSTLLNLSERYNTNQFIFCWDSPGSIRKEIFPKYKAHRRDGTPEEVAERARIHKQFNVLREEILPALRFNNQFFVNGFEADDLIAEFVVRKLYLNFIVVSSDHDLFQLLQYANCKGQHSLTTGKLMNASRFMAEYRIPARRWVAVKALAGCPGDGVPGIPGIGEPTAIKYLLDELPVKGKKYKAITSLGGTAIFHRNVRLVRLPLAGVPTLELKEDRFDEETVFQTFSDLGWDSFLDSKQKDRWEKFCRLP